MAVGRPVIIAARIKFLFVDPVNLAIQKVVVTVAGEDLLLPVVHVSNIQVVFANIGYAIAGGREFWINRGVGARGELNGGPAIETVEPELTKRIKQQVLGIRRPVV